MKASFGIQSEEKPDHKNSTLLTYYDDWENLNKAKEEWTAPKDEEFIISVWKGENPSLATIEKE